MGDRLLRYMADQAQPVRLYSPNPDAPQWSGLPPTPEEPRPSFGNRLWNAIKNTPGQLWGMLPAEAQRAYTSGFKTMVDMSTPASVRDYTTSAQDTARSAVQGDGWGTATNALATVNAALGAIPVAGLGVAAARKVANEVGEAAGKGAAKTIRAYHGSPHNFDRFDISKIGTGEGAQAYGHGLYFAENEGIARAYRDNLAGKASPVTYQAYKNGEAVPWHTLSQDQTKLLPILQEAGGDLGKAKEIVSAQYMPGAHDRLMRGLDDLVAQGFEARAPGHMYEVQINADPAKFLDWDKPLAQQAPEVQRALADLKANVGDAEFAKMTGGGAYQTLGSDTNDVLTAAGVPGIKYLDQGSRAAGDGSRNYVVFDDKLIEILRKYGLLPFAGAAGMAALPTENDGMVR